MTAVSPTSGAVAGGTVVTILGTGFMGGYSAATANDSIFDFSSEDCQHLQVTIGPTLLCQVQSCSEEKITCVTENRAGVPAAVDNSGRNTEFGLGYQFSSREVRVEAGGFLRIAWTATKYTGTKHGFTLAAREAPREPGLPAPAGFASPFSRDGSFWQWFPSPGAYNITSSSYGWLNFSGTVNVLPLEASSLPVRVVVAGVEAKHASESIDNATDV